MLPMSPASPLPVKVLSFTSPACISVRPLQWEKGAHELQVRLYCHYNETEPVDNNNNLVSTGTVCAAKCDNRWYRAVVVECLMGTEGITVTVRLVDQGRIATTDIENILPLDPQFLCSPTFSFFCHLHGLQPMARKELQEDLVVEMTGLLPPSHVVTLLRRGPPVESSGQQSLPVDLTWEVVTMPDPFQPNLVKEFSLTELCAEKFGLTTGSMEDTVTEDLSDELDSAEADTHEFSHVEPLKCSENFHWLDPELPPTTRFAARGTFVDESGQVYIQLHAQRHTVRVIRKLLNEKFSSSEPELPAIKLSHMQECCVRWRDGNWYRARFVKYLDTEEQECLVVLVDYGNMFRVKEEDIRRTIYCEHIPIQSLATVLAGVRPVGDTWSPACLDFMQEKINYAKEERNYKLVVKMEGKSLSQPLHVSISISDESKLGVKLDLAQLLAMLPGEVTTGTLPGPLRKLRKSLYWGVKEKPAGHYKAKNPYLLLCPQRYPVQQEQISVIPNMDWHQVWLMEGQRLQVRLVDIESYNCVYLQPAASQPQCEDLARLTAKHTQLAALAQAQCEVNPPVFQPRPGLPVAVRWGVEGWFRAVILECTDTAVFVKYVDYGTSDWVEDSMMIKEMPAEWGALAALAIPLQLSVEAVETDLDILTSLMMECLWTCEEDMWVRFDRMEEGGRLQGHLVNQVTGDLLYKGLLREGVIEIKKSLE
eukprot:GFUD01019728.1.p1 GENE.GFUD01019728.1~~GFUD01019728.1.p1  ORF type:complete len:707 (-),score=233.78 GFUD01019728.1:80-2200(-)